jgi:hypothetical protein
VSPNDEPALYTRVWVEDLKRRPLKLVGTDHHWSFRNAADRNGEDTAHTTHLLFFFSLSLSLFEGNTAHTSFLDAAVLALFSKASLLAMQIHLGL